MTRSAKMVDGQADPAAQPHLHPQHRQRLAGVPEPLVRPAAGSYTVPYTVYTTGIGWRTDKVTHGHRGNGRTRTTCSGTRRTRARSPSSTTGTPRWRWCLLRERQGRTINTTDPADLAEDAEAACWTCRPPPSPRSPITMYNDLPGRPAGAVPDVVRRRRQRAVLPAQGQSSRRAALLVPRGRQGHGRQRPDGRPARAARTRSSRTCSSTTCSTPRRRSGNFCYIGYQPPQTSLDSDKVVSRRLRPGQPRRPRSSSSEYVRRRATACSSCRPPPTPPGTRSGRRSRPGLTDRSPRSNHRRPPAAPGRPAQGRRRTWAREHWLWPLLALPGIVWLVLFFLAAAVRRAGHRVRPDRPGLPHPAAGVEPVAVEHRPSSPTCSRTSSARTAIFGPALLRTAGLRRCWRACCAC